MFSENMETQSVTGKPIPVIELNNQPHPASWVDRITDWVNSLPIPAWSFYLCLWLLFFILACASTWLDGTQPVGRLGWIYVFYTFYGIYFLGAIHYLDSWAKTAFESFRPALAVGETGQSQLFYQLTTMPARMIWILTAATLIVLVASTRLVIFPLWQAMGFFHQSILAVLIDLGIFYFNGLIVLIFIYHTIHQLRWIGRIHSSASHINLFHLRPLYALSGLTARTAGVLLIVGYIIEQQSGTHDKFTSDPYVLQVSELFPLLSLVMYSLLAAAVFFLPLLGLHQLLLKEKERLQLEGDARLQAQILMLHQQIDTRQLKDAEAMNCHLSSLALEREILAKLPTWPWKPGTLNVVLTAVLLPIILWVLQQLLTRWGGF